MSYVYLLTYDYLHYNTCNMWVHIRQYIHIRYVRPVYTMQWGGDDFCILFATSSQVYACVWCEIFDIMTTYMITPILDHVTANQFRLGDNSNIYEVENNGVYCNDDVFLYTVCLYQKYAYPCYGVMNLIFVKVITRTALRIRVYQVPVYMKPYVYNVQSQINLCTVCVLYQNVSPYQAIYQTLFFLFHMRRLYGYGPLAVHGVYGDPLVPETRRGALTSFHRSRSSTTTSASLQHNEWIWTFSSSVASPALEGLHSLDAEIFPRYFYAILTVAELPERQNTPVLLCCGCVLCLSLDWAIFSAKVPISHTSTGRTIQGIIECEFMVVCIWVDVPYYLELCILYYHPVCIFVSKDASIEYFNLSQDIYTNVYDLYPLQSIPVHE